MSLLRRAVGPAALLAPPVDPDAATARRWAREELADPIYHQHKSILARLLEWITQQLAGLRHGLPSLATLVIVVVVLAVVIAVAFLVTGPVRRNRRAARHGGTVLDAADRRSAAQLRAAADAAAAREDWSSAVVERFRAIVRGLEDRVVIDELPGRTADEAVSAAAARLPDLGDELAAAGRLFDDVAYGGRTADRSDDAQLRRTDDAARSARPVANVGLVASAVPR